MDIKNKNVSSGLIVTLPCSSLEEFHQSSKKNQAQNNPFHYPELPVETRGHVKDNTSKPSAPFNRREKRKLW